MYFGIIFYLESNKHENINKIYKKCREIRRRDIVKRQNGEPILRPKPKDIMKYFLYHFGKNRDLFRNDSFNGFRPKELSKPTFVYFEE